MFKEANHYTRTATHVMRRKEARNEAVPEGRKEKQPHSYKQVVNKKRKRDVYETPLYMNPECKAKKMTHYISKRNIFNNETKTKLLEQNRQAKGPHIDDTPRNSGNGDRITRTLFLTRSSIFRVSFARVIGTSVMAGQGADANFTSDKILDKIIQKVGRNQRET